MIQSILQYWLIEPTILIQKSKTKYLRYILRYLLRWKQNYAWIKYLNSSHEIRAWKQDCASDLYLKIQQPYLSGHLTFQEKLEYLKDHYNWFFQHFKAKHYQQDETLLWSTDLEVAEQVSHIQIHLKYKSIFPSEGETALILRLNGHIQYILTFTYVNVGGVPTFFIGGAQGGRQDETNPEIIKQFTKSLFGLRPKQLMIHAISILADFYKVQSLIGVSNHNHVFQRSRNKRNRVKTNLDDFWQNFDAMLAQDGNYYFKPISHIIDLEEIQSKKRSQYRKRQVILNDFVDQCQQNLMALSKV